MDQNKAAINALQEYVKIEKPGYAFMIEAPWGAGKTHLVKNELKDQLLNDKARYVTLNGVPDRKAFRRSLLASTSDAKLTDTIGKAGNAFGKILKLGDVGSLTQNFIEDWMINNLPNLLIFDDVERCNMSPDELLGMINDFVEHQKKNVVLCAFIERDNEIDGHMGRDNFLSRKEKVVGRTVRIMADTNKAVPEFISSIPDGHGKSWFQSNVDMVIEVFSDAEHNNLRVLRQCLHDLGRVIDVLDEDLLQSTEAMIRFARTYLVLAMALATGEINSTHLHERKDHRCVTKPADGTEPHPLFNCYKRHQHAEIFAGNAASIVPVDLGVSLIGVGYEAPDKINEGLRATGQFSGEQEIPLWRRFVEWRGIRKDELEKTHAEAVSYVFDKDMIEPGPYLHLAHDLIWITSSGCGNTEETRQKIEDRIGNLRTKKLIPAAAYGSDFGWNTDGGAFSFGGYGFKPDENTTPIIKAMRDAQLAAFKELQINEAERLLGLLRENLEAFGHEFSGRISHEGYYNTAILHKIDTDNFAKVVFDYVTSGEIEAVGRQLQALADRHRSNDMPDELSWAEKLKAELISLAEKTSAIEKARMHWFMGLYWKFPTVDEDDT